MNMISGGNGSNDDDNPKKAGGYKSPPLHGRIKPGEVRNPYGRNGRKKDRGDAFEKARRRPGRITINGETTTVENEEAFWLGQWARAMQNDKSAARLVWQELRARHRLEPTPPTAEELSQEAAELVERERMANRLVNLLEQKAEAKRGGAALVRYGPDGRPIVEPPVDDATSEPSDDD